MTAEWLTMFKIQGLDAWWLPYSPKGRLSRCDRCSARVWKERPRMRIANSLGPERKGGHGHRHQYLCIRCAWEGYASAPPDYPYTPTYNLEPPDQGTLL